MPGPFPTRPQPPPCPPAPTLCRWVQLITPDAGPDGGPLYRAAVVAFEGPGPGEFIVVAFSVHNVEGPHPFHSSAPVKLSSADEGRTWRWPPRT